MNGLQRMRERSAEAQEHEASRLFSSDNINAVLSAAAAQGQTAAIFAPSVSMDLSDAPTAKAVKSMLERAGFLAEWKILRQTPDGDPHKVLRVSWGVDAAPRNA